LIAKYYFNKYEIEYINGDLFMSHFTVVRAF